MGLTTRLNVIFSTTWSTQESFQSPPLPLYQTTRVKIETEYNTIKFYFNDTLVQTSRTYGWRSSGDAFLNVSQSKLQPALVHLVDDVVMKELPSIGLTPNLAQQKVPTQVIVPQNYIIAFNITPLLNSGYYENILEYVGNDLPSYVLPSITYVLFNLMILTNYWVVFLQEVQRFQWHLELQSAPTSKFKVLHYLFTRRL